MHKDVLLLLAYAKKLLYLNRVVPKERRETRRTKEKKQRKVLLSYLNDEIFSITPYAIQIVHLFIYFHLCCKQRR
uniref:Uncharacterized protein n=1 Tax=Rhizophora mucronata TaxID=61149 RepID=A0A2P2KG72_RHIMU